LAPFSMQLHLYVSYRIRNQFLKQFKWVSLFVCRGCQVKSNKESVA
jgi:hypothetical protein